MKQSPSLILSLFTMFNLKSHLFGSLLHSKKVTVQIITFKFLLPTTKIEVENLFEKENIYNMLRDRQYIIDGGGF